MESWTYLIIFLVEVKSLAHAKAGDLCMLFADEYHVAGGEITMYNFYALEVFHAESNLIHKFRYFSHVQAA